MGSEYKRITIREQFINLINIDENLTDFMESNYEYGYSPTPDTLLECYEYLYRTSE